MSSFHSDYDSASSSSDFEDNEVEIQQLQKENMEVIIFINWSIRVVMYSYYFQYFFLVFYAINFLHIY